MADIPVSRIPDGGSVQLLKTALAAPGSKPAFDRYGVRNVARPFADTVFAGVPGQLQQKLLVSIQRGRSRGWRCCSEGDRRCRLRAQASGQEAVSRASAARARRHSWRHAPVRRAAARGCRSSARMSPRPSRGSRARGRSSRPCGRRSPAGIVRRSPSRGAVPRRAARMGRSELPRHAAVREVRPAPAAQPPGRAVRPTATASPWTSPGRASPPITPTSRRSRGLPSRVSEHPLVPDACRRPRKVGGVAQIL